MLNYIEHYKKIMIPFLIGSLFATILELLLFLRLTPFGVLYVMDTSHYLFHSIYYKCFGIALVTFFFALIRLIFYKVISLKADKLLLILHIFIIFVSLIIQLINNELIRFMGIQLSFDWIATYVNFNGPPTAIWQAIVDDKGGAYSSVLSLLIPLLFLIITKLCLKIKISINTNKILFKIFNLALVLFLVMYLVVAPFIFRSSRFGGKNRQEKVKPPIVLLRDCINDYNTKNYDINDVKNDIALVQNWWNESEDNKNWKFVSEKNPFLKKYTNENSIEAKEKWNFVIISLETFRAFNINFLNPEAKLDATPFLNSLALSEHGAYWNRFISNGIPTIHSLMAIHTSIPPHSHKTVAKSFTMCELESFPSFLKKEGYYSIFLGGSDPDWSNERFWFNKWYDDVYFDPKDKEHDRPVFQEASKRLKEIGNKQNFVATIFSISNHVPFRSPENNLDLYHGDDLKMKIYNTMHYTDAVLKEFFESIENETWFDKTVFIITGDHGYDLGDRGVQMGHTNSRHENSWVPLVMYSKHPLQPNGKQSIQGSHIDIAPTILEMAGVFPDNEFIGHSLFSKNKNDFPLHIKSNNFGGELDQFSIYIPTGTTKPMLYKANDYMQINDLSTQHKDVVQTYVNRAKVFSSIVDYYYEKGFLFDE